MSAILVIDPYLNSPELAVYNQLSGRLGMLMRHPRCSLTHLIFFAPRLAAPQRLRDFVNTDIAGVICLGSAANLTDTHPWVQTLQEDLGALLHSRGLPFLGICFSHQLLGHMFGFQVDYVDGRHNLPFGKYRNPRRVQVVHPKLRLLLSALPASSRFSQDGPDLDWRDAWRTSLGFSLENWRTFRAGSFLTAPEVRLHRFLQSHSVDHFFAHARHEQEVKTRWVCANKRGFLKEDVQAARSIECEIDGLVHPTLPWFGFQTHPETPCPLITDGARMLDQFLYLCALRKNHDL